MAKSTTPKLSTPEIEKPRAEREAELRYRLKQLENDFTLSQGFLEKQRRICILVTAYIFIITILGFLLLAWKEQVLFTGEQFILLTSAIAIALTFNAYFIFGRNAKVRAEITAAKKQLEILLEERKDG